MSLEENANNLFHRPIMKEKVKQEAEPLEEKKSSKIELQNNIFFPGPGKAFQFPIQPKKVNNFLQSGSKTLKSEKAMAKKSPKSRRKSILQPGRMIEKQADVENAGLVNEAPLSLKKQTPIIRNFHSKSAFTNSLGYLHNLAPMRTPPLISPESAKINLGELEKGSNSGMNMEERKSEKDKEEYTKLKLIIKMRKER